MRYVDFLDVDVENIPSLGQIDFDLDLARLASLRTADGQHLISHWLDPLAGLAVAFGSTGQERLRDAASTEIYAQPPSAAIPTRSTDLNGQPTLEITQGTPGCYYPIQNEVAVNASAWSVLGVFNVPSDSTDTMAFISKGDNVSVAAGRLWPSLRLVNATGGAQLAIAEVGTNTARVNTPIRADLRGRTVYAVGTFSTDLGLRLYVDGVQAATNPSDVRPLTHPNVGFLANTPNTGNSLPAYGQFGWQMVFRADLSAADYAGSRAIIDEIVMRRYGIPA